MKLDKKLKSEVEEYVQNNKLSPKEKDKLLELVTSLYNKTLYDPEEPIGVVTAQSLSEPATQMSLDFDEKIVLKHNGSIRIARIGEFIDKSMESFGKKDIDGWEVCDVYDKELFVPSLNQEEKIEWRKVKEISRHNSPDSMMEIKTLSGRKITATDSHSFVTRMNNRIIPVSGKNLKIGNRIPSLLFLPENCMQKLETSKYLNDQKFARKTLPEVLNLNKELGWIFGAYLAEGNSTEFYVSFSNTNPMFLSKIRDFAKKFGFTFNEYDNPRGFSLSHDIRVNSKQLPKLMKNTCGTGSALKKVPYFAYSADKDFVSGLLSGYFDWDGNVSVDRRVIRVSSRSENLIDGISLLLTRFGIFARKQKRKENSLSIPYKYADKFKNEIGFTIASKSQKLDELHSLFNKNKRKYQDFVDLIGGFDDILLTVCKKLSLPYRTVNSFTKRQKIGRIVLEKYIENFESISSQKRVNIENELAILKRMTGSDIIWDEITEINRIKPTKKYVYDLTIPGNETFTTFDGIITHNTMRTYHFAGTAGIQVTLGLPRMLEIFDARKEPRTPTMTIYIRPEVQHIDNVKKIAENIREVKAKDIILSIVIDLTDMTIACKLDVNKINKLGIDLKKFPKIMKIRNTDSKIENDTLIVSQKKKDLKNIHKLKYAVLEQHIKGIKGISQVVVTKEGNEWIINTLGSNLKKVFDIEGVDPTRTISNNIFEMYDVLGIEVARTTIINQASYTVEEQGLGVDIRYIMLLADLMTATGKIKAIGRYGISGEKSSVLVRASFEETKKHLTAAAIRGEKDLLQGTVENVMMNQLAPIGTGDFDLIGWIPSLKKGKR